MKPVLNILLSIAAALPLFAAPARADTLLPAGSDESVWLLRRGAGDAYDGVRRGAGGKWEWVWQGSKGLPVAAVATGSRLHLLLADNAYLMVDATGQQTVGPRAHNWPGGGALSACDVGSLTTNAGGAIVAIVPKLVTATPDTAPDAGSGRPGLGVYLSGPAEWKHLTDLPNVPVDADTRVSAAVSGGALYVCISSGPGENRLVAWKARRWKDVPLPALLADGHVLGLVPGRGKSLTAVCAVDADEPGERHIILAAMDAGGEGFSTPAQPVLRDGKAVPWPEKAHVLVTRLGDGVAMLWHDEAVLKFALVASTGNLISIEDVTVLDNVPVQGQGQEIIHYFTIGVVAALVLSMLILRPKNAPRVFQLPPAVAPGNLGRRLLAGLMDLVPFFLLSAAVFPLPPLAFGDIGDTDKFLDRMAELMAMESYAYSVVLAMATYVIYCVAMEYRFGATLGKRAMKLRVVGNGAAPAGLREVVLRNLVKVIELMSLPLLLLVPLITRNRQRLGDLFAQTAVVDATARPPAEPEDDPRDDPPPLPDETDPKA